jgi:hypothetical protein
VLDQLKLAKATRISIAETEWSLEENLV